MAIRHATAVVLAIACAMVQSENIAPPDVTAASAWNIRTESVDSAGAAILAELFSDPATLEVEILASFSAWSESPLYVDSIRSVLFTSPSDRNLYAYNLDSQETSILIENAGVFGGVYERDIPFDECNECGPNGITMGLAGFEDYVFMDQLGLGRVIAFDPANVNDTFVVADMYAGTELNSPNDITLTADGQVLYFTDPTFGLQRAGDTGQPGFVDSFARSQLGFQGVYRVDAEDVENGNTVPRLVVEDMPGPNGVAVTNDGASLIVSNTGNPTAWAPYWNVYAVPDSTTDSGTALYTLEKTITLPSALAYDGDVPLADGMEVYNSDVLFAICPGGICVMDLNAKEIVARITIDHLVSNMHSYDGYLYVTGNNNLFRIALAPEMEVTTTLDPSTDTDAAAVKLVNLALAGALLLAAIAI